MGGDEISDGGDKLRHEEKKMMMKQLGNRGYYRGKRSAHLQLIADMLWSGVENGE